jgi:hypothetical protein
MAGAELVDLVNDAIAEANKSTDANDQALCACLSAAVGAWKLREAEILLYRLRLAMNNHELRTTYVGANSLN